MTSELVMTDKQAANELLAETMTTPQVDVEHAATQWLATITDVSERDVASQQQVEKQVAAFGQATVESLAQRTELLKTPLQTLVADADSGGETAQSLLSLQQTVNSVNPNRFDFSTGTIRRMLSALPFIGSPIARWFAKYQTAEAVINDIVNTLKDGEARLKRDNEILLSDQAAYRQLTFTLTDDIAIGKRLAAKIEAHLANEPSAFISEQVLLPLKQRIVDLQQTLAVNQQAIVTCEVIVQNNKELIRGVNRAINVTVSALKTASMMAIALSQQKKLLNATKAVNDTTSDLLVETSESLRQQGSEIQQQAAGGQLDIDKLKLAFNNIDAALTDISQYRQKVLPKMSATINEMDALTAQMSARIEAVSQ